MEKSNKTHSAVVLSKHLRAGGEKIIFRFTASKTAEAILCFAMQFSGVFASMSPFGTAFYAAVFRPDSWIANFAMSLLGIILSGQQAFWSYAVVLTALTAVFAVSEKVCKSTSLRAAASSVIFLSLSAVRCISTSFTSFDILALVMESIMLGMGVIVFTSGFGVFSNFRKRSFVSEKESICAYAFIAILLLSLQKIPPIAGLKASSVASVLVIFIMSMSAERSSVLTLAILVGVISTLGGGESGTVMGTYAFGALLATAFKKYGKTGVMLGFVIANTAASLFLSDAEQVIIGIYDSFAAAIIFVFMPQKILEFFDDLTAKTASFAVNTGRDAAPSDAGVKKLVRIADSIGELGKIYQKTANEKNAGQSYVKMMSAQVCAKTCTGCKNKGECFADGGAALAAIYELWQSTAPKITATSLPKELRQKCHRCDSFAEAARGCVQVMKTERQWLGKMNESRRLIAEQLEGISESVLKECHSIASGRNRELEEKIWTQLDMQSFRPNRVYARSDGSEFEIEVSFDTSLIDRQTKKLVQDAVERAAAETVRFAGMKKCGSEVVFSYAPYIGYNASFGYATRAKNGEKVCGDSFNVIYTNGSSIVMALSDGMGSGKKASEESKATIELLDKFLTAGFDCEKAVKLINSSLLLKGEKDTFATIDICDINFEAATLSFTKLGAADAYIKTKDKTVRVKGASLPAGILKEAHAEKHMLPIDSDTLVVLMSDGVADVALKDAAQEGWIEKELEKLSASNPQIIAGKLLESAIRRAGSSVHDDMTIVVGCISKTNS